MDMTEIQQAVKKRLEFIKLSLPTFFQIYAISFVKKDIKKSQN